MTLDEGFHRFEHPDVRRGMRASQPRTSRRFLRRVRDGKVDCCVHKHRSAAGDSISILFARAPGSSAGEVYDLFVEVCPVVLGVTLADTDRARDLVCGAIRTSARDAVHAAVMLNNDVEWIATFDAGFDEIAGIRRVKLS